MPTKKPRNPDVADGQNAARKPKLRSDHTCGGWGNSIWHKVAASPAYAQVSKRKVRLF
ncbi:hypothetical protein COO91_01339 [Nostoc flagelliforme CCNUN1]|uniref:Uncharacterized protein n=1 Tax=Nostoc flagelliforme CCNUN1 TaxID=2038116 RepID=A0A2K8SJ37_9NOSO|nr:hypothetical protein [Nostoc flagelliforme]AUB35459.1 hypothetical protein COO91_01339 [Nostoc flagelliforme CCNUN1]